jgi:hypothetical protein
MMKRATTAALALALLCACELLVKPDDVPPPGTSADGGSNLLDGGCQPISCPAKACGDVPDHCGGALSCGCPTGQRCDTATSTCVTGCSSGQHVCGNACVANDVAACGQSCQQCPLDPHGTPNCDGTRCALNCVDGYRMCGPSCASCPSHGLSFTCEGASCQAVACAVGFTVCDGACCSWHLESVMTEKASGTVALAIDPGGASELAYYAPSPQEIHWARRVSAGSWTVEAVAGVNDLSQVTQVVDLAVTSAGDPIVLHRSGSPGPLMLGERKGGGWSSTTVDSGAARAPAIALEAGGRVHVAYLIAGTDFDLFHATREATGGAWTRESALATISADGVNTALSLDGSGKPWIAVNIFQIGPNFDSDAIRLYSHTGASWTNVTVESGLSYGLGLRLSVDAASAPHLAYVDLDGASLRYAVGDGGTWKLSDVSMGSVADEGQGLSLTAAGVPHLAFVTGTSSLRHASPGAAGFEVELLDSDAAGVALAVDARGWPRMAYRTTAGALRCAWWGAD